MDEIPIEYKAALILAVETLREEPAPTSIGHNDMAVMIAYGQSLEFGIPTINTDMISRFLSKHLAVPKDARMQPKVVQGYLEKLADSRLIDEEQKQGDYRMRDDTSTYLVAYTKMLKSPHIDELLFHGFRLYSAWEIKKQKTRNTPFSYGF